MSLVALFSYHLLTLIELALAALYWLVLQTNSRLSDRRENWKAGRKR